MSRSSIPVPAVPSALIPGGPGPRGRVLLLATVGFLSFAAAFGVARVLGDDRAESGPSLERRAQAEPAPGVASAAGSRSGRSSGAGGIDRPERSDPDPVRYDVQMSTPGGEPGVVQTIEVVNDGEYRSMRISFLGELTTEVLASAADVWIRTVPVDAPEGRRHLSEWFHDATDDEQWSGYLGQDEEFRAALDGELAVGDRFWTLPIHEVEHVDDDHVRLLVGDHDGVVVEITRSGAVGTDLEPPAIYRPLAEMPTR